ncbi:phosphotransferase [Curtobacterium flaccumfaciens]|nr:phosphotransferase [Curtobacterium flaccumfaciens]
MATTAVPGLLVTGTRTLGSAAAGDYESALLRDADGTEIVIRRPRNQRAEARQSADLVAIRALSAGIRTRLPFGVVEYRGQAPIGSTRAIVTTRLSGTHPTLASLVEHPDLATSVGRAVAAIHQLPTSFVSDAGLPSLTPFEVLRSAVSVMDRAVATKLVPAALVERWEGAARDQQLWQFTPTVVHGSLGTGALLVDGDAVTGILDWGELRLGDPAKDLAWVLAGRRDAFRHRPQCLRSERRRSRPPARTACTCAPRARDSALAAARRPGEEHRGRRRRRRDDAPPGRRGARPECGATAVRVAGDDGDRRGGAAVVLHRASPRLTSDHAAERRSRLPALVPPGGHRSSAASRPSDGL